MSGKRVLSVGQCGFDHGSIARTLQSAFDAEVVPASTAAEAVNQLRQGEFALVLVNRVLDDDGSSGIDLIRKVKADPELAVPVMLVSNHDDAQQEAVAAGAASGFGKSQLGRADMLARLEPFLG
jgi:two-component system chemotaxis response regulator CheY